jgi:predicted acetyltransferase
LETTTLTSGVQRKPTESDWSVNWRDSDIGWCLKRYLNLRRRRASLKRIFTPVRGRYSAQSISRNLHGLSLWEQRMAYSHALELIAKHKIWEERVNIHCGEK